MNSTHKRVLIVGANSYIGTRFAAYGADRFDVTTIDARSQNWDDMDMCAYDTVLHVAGIAHIKQTRQSKPLFYEINRDLAVTVATKAKASGVRQFIFISTMAAHKVKQGDYYGDSKNQAEEIINGFCDDNFKVAIVRPPMVYGPGCKGNFPRLVGLVRRLPIFPNIQNERSMIYIDNLCEFLCRLIKTGDGGVYHPQNKAYVQTTQMAQFIAAYQGKKLRTTRLFNFLIHLLMRFVPSLEKLFGTYDFPFGGDEDAYNVVDFEESIRVSVCISSSNV